MDKPKVLFIGLNPSTANEISNDPTINRVMRFANDWGYGGVYMMNIFGLVSQDPSVLRTHHDPMGDNRDWIGKISDRCQDVVFAWGAFKEAKCDHARWLQTIFPRALCLGRTKDGSPKHPLYITANIKPILYR